MTTRRERILDVLRGNSAAPYDRPLTEMDKQVLKKIRDSDLRPTPPSTEIEMQLLCHRLDREAESSN